MSKREATIFAAQGVDVDAPRAKRHKPVPQPQLVSSPRKGESEAGNGVAVKAETQEVKALEDVAVVREKGLKLWQIIKDAVNKE